MIIRNISLAIVTIVFFVMKSSANVKVKINIYPKTLKAGDDLTVECLIFNITATDRLKTFFRCPFFEKNAEYCYADCISICQHFPCTEKSKFIDTFKCSWQINQNPRRFTFNMPSISKEQINGRKILPFSCKYMGLEVRDNVTVLETSEPNSGDNGGGSLIITDKKKKPITSSSMDPSHSKDMFNIGLRDIILIILIFSLLTSFFINIWCSVQWCIRRSKSKKRKRELQSNNNLNNTYQPNDQRNFQNTSFNPENNDNTVYSANFDREDHIRRARSQPALLNSGKNTPVKISTSNLHKRPGSVNYNMRCRPPNYNSSVNEIYQNGSVNEPFLPFVAAPFMGYNTSQFYPQNYILTTQPYYHMNASQSEDLNTDLGEDSPESMQSSTIQPLPKKPDDRQSNLESTSSSLIV